ncbi:hypothetical protein T439DRAFT_322411 [Meredithblackwellia eburnea MCA 4105]
MPPKRPASSSTNTTTSKRSKKDKSKEKENHSSEDVDVEAEPQHTSSTPDDLPPLMAKTPFAKVLKAQEALNSYKIKAPKPDKDGVIVYWMRNKDLRLTDNRALALASSLAKSTSLPLVVLHIFSPSDYVSHDRSPRRIDFQLRALRLLQKDLESAKHNVPLYSVTWDKREQVVEKLLVLLKEWGTAHLVANLEYEVDELRRDEAVLESVMQARKRKAEGEFQGDVQFLQDFCVVNPGTVSTQQDKPYSVFSPWYRNWSAIVASDTKSHIGDAGGLTHSNPSSSKSSHPVLKSLFSHTLPSFIEGFKLSKDDQETMEHLWPVGEKAAGQVMDRFLRTKMREQTFQHPPLHPGAEKVGLKDSKIGVYGDGRNRVDMDGTSHISPYLAAGMISPRQCLRLTMELTNNKLQTDKNGGGVGIWVSEVAWRDFYQHVMCAWPRVSMCRPFLLKYDDVVWEENEEHLQAWKDGRTGFPIVDAAMRALKKQGYMHNRCRMIVAMFLTKDLMLDWRLGEKWFMQNLIDGDLGSNNGGWQWSASTGTDPQPYFRVFNPTSQSEKSDPTGDYIRFWVPELKKLKGKVIHDPSSALSKKELEKMGYCAPIVDHKMARVRAIARYKNPGDKFDE